MRAFPSEPVQWEGSLSTYACMGANAIFAFSGFITFFMSTFGDDPFAHFNSQPQWMFMSFCSFAVAVFSIAGGRILAGRFRKIAATPADPGDEYSRYSKLKTTFSLSAIITVVLAWATFTLAMLWGTAAVEYDGFRVPYICGILAVTLDMVAVLDDSWLFFREHKAFKRATGTNADLEDGSPGEIRI